MKHERTTLASCENFGSISSCSCGLYHIHLPGVSIHLNEKRFENLIKMVLQAKENQDSYRINDAKLKKSHLKIVRN
ncbi:MAG: hypothetical protein SRB2_04022 [Desulfobacteraceae bacterium Eth-SRB2]|nr:MAG: hypothetical protein SRB2_04022 [Desulfobacteraceae bacterium Eth-SRB2]